MSQIHYGVVRHGNGWAIIGQNLRVGGYARRRSAVLAVRKLALKCGGLPVHLHLQDESGELLPPKRIEP